MTLHWNGLLCNARVTRQHETFSEPGWVEVSDLTLELDDDEEFSMLLDEYEMPSSWKSFPADAEHWVRTKFGDSICDMILD